MHNDRIKSITTQLESIAKSDTAIFEERNTQTVQKTDNLTEANWPKDLTQALRPHQSDNWHKWDKQELTTYQGHQNSYWAALRRIPSDKIKNQSIWATWETPLKC